MLLLAILGHTCRVTRYSRQTNTFSKVKVPWLTYSHCLKTTWF